MLPAEGADAQPAIVPLRHHLPPEGFVMPVIPRPFVSVTAISLLGHRFTPIYREAATFSSLFPPRQMGSADAYGIDVE